MRHVLKTNAYPRMEILTRKSSTDPTWYQLVLVPGLQVQQTAKERSGDDEVCERTLADLRYLLAKKDQVEDFTTNVFLAYDAVEQMASGVGTSSRSYSSRSRPS